MPKSYNRRGWMLSAYAAFRRAHPYRRRSSGRRGPIKKISTRNRSGQGVTAQFDRSKQYTRKRAPLRKRRRMARRMRGFKRTVMKMKGSRTLMTNQRVSSSGGPTLQGVISAVLFGGKVDGAGQPTQLGYDDLNDLRQRDYMIGDPTGDAQKRFAPGAVKFYVMTGVMDMTIQNVSTYLQPPEDPISIGIEMDIYEFYCRKLPGNSAGNTVEAAMQYFQNDVYLPGTAGVNLATLQLTDRGCTPFEMGFAMSKFGMKIIKKTKYFLGPNETCTYQIRDTKMRMFDGDDLYNWNSPTTNSTHGVLIIHKVTPQFSDQLSATSSIVAGITRKYKYYVDSSAAVRAAEWNPVG